MTTPIQIDGKVHAEFVRACFLLGKKPIGATAALALQMWMNAHRSKLKAAKLKLAQEGQL